MAYPEFTLSGLTRQFGLTLNETTDLFADVPEAALRPDFLARLNTMLLLALATSTEKARSEFIIAPILLELWLLHDRKIGLLSGVEFSIDEAQGLSGVCDYIITRSPEQLFVKAPVLMLVEAKNEDMKKGFAQCGAEMLAAQRFNEREGTTVEHLYGVVTIGELWRFMQLEGTLLRIDSRSYHIDRLPKIMGILLRLTEFLISACVRDWQDSEGRGANQQTAVETTRECRNETNDGLRAGCGHGMPCRTADQQQDVLRVQKRVWR